MKKLLEMTKRFRDEEDGAAMIEYTVLLGIITVAVIATIIIVGTWIGGEWEELRAALPGAGAAPE